MRTKFHYLPAAGATPAFMRSIAADRAAGICVVVVLNRYQGGILARLDAELSDPAASTAAGRRPS